MKTYTENAFHRLLLVVMSPREQAMSDAEIEQWIIQLPEIKELSIDMMRRAVFGSFPAKLSRRHLTQLRKECTLMLDTLYRYPASAGRMQEFSQMVSNCLLQILEFQELHYAENLDGNITMPIVLFNKAAQKVEEKTVLLVTAMSRYNVDKQLQAIVVTKMTGLLKRGSGSWHQIRYLEKLQVGITGLCVGLVANITEQLRSLLLRRNFNTLGFITYCKSRIEEEMAEKYKIDEQYDCLYHYLLEFNCLSSGHKLDRYDPSQASLKPVLLQYVKSLLNIANKRNLVVTQNKAANPGVVTPYRLPMSISVDALAYLIKLLVMTNVITAVKADLLLFISRNFKTPGVGDADLSLKSLDNKYRQVVKNTSIAVRSILMKMLKQLDNEFG